MKKKFLTWLKFAGIRGLKTFAQTAASLITVGAMVSDVDWAMVFSSAAVALVYSLLTSIAGLPEIPKENTEGEAVTNGYDGESGK